MSTAKVSQLQLLQQNLQNIVLQKQQIESQISEFDSALTELNTSQTAYKIVGKIMIASSKDELQKDLSQKKEIIEIRLKNIIKQEENIKNTIEKVQKEVVEELGKQKK
jgi:prefoldin beta subunit